MPDHRVDTSVARLREIQGEKRDPAEFGTLYTLGELRLHATRSRQLDSYDRELMLWSADAIEDLLAMVLGEELPLVELPISEMDPECVALCRAMNRLEGIRTVESCCGHGEQNYRVFFYAETLAALGAVARYFDPTDQAPSSHWLVVAFPTASSQPVMFCAQGPNGPAAYREAEQIAAAIEAGVEAEHGP